MHLTDYDIDNFVREQINVYLTKDNPTFATLKSQILSKDSIAQVHSNIVEELTQVRNADVLETKREIEKLACNEQLIEDQEQKKRDNADRLKDEELKDRLTRDLNHIPTLESSYANESALLKLQLNQSLETLQKLEIMYQHEQNQATHQHGHTPKTHQHGHTSEAHQHGHTPEAHQHGHTPEAHQHGHTPEAHQHGHTPEAHQHGHTPEAHQHGHTPEAHQHGHTPKTHQHVESPTYKALEAQKQAINQLKITILGYESKTHALQKQKETIKKELEEIVRGEERRLARHLKIIEREQARIEFQTTGEGVEKTLSCHNITNLRYKLSSNASHIFNQHSDLITRAININYTYFLEVLPKYLAATKALSEPEISALNTILKLMNHYFQQKEKTNTIENSLYHKKKSIHDQISKLEELNKKLEDLRKKNPRLTSENTCLTEHNVELAHSLEQNKNLHQRLKGPALLLLVLTVLFTIPLILTLNGIIPFFMTPVLVYTLVSAPPALLFLATLATGIAASIYSSRAHSDESQINMNNKIIKSNNIQMGSNTQDQHKLVTIIIPNLEAEIKTNEAERELLNSSLQESKEMTKQLFKQATETQPVLYSKSAFLEEDRSRREKDSEELSSSLEETSMTNGI